MRFLPQALVVVLAVAVPAGCSGARPPSAGTAAASSSTTDLPPLASQPTAPSARSSAPAASSSAPPPRPPVDQRAILGPHLLDSRDAHPRVLYAWVPSDEVPALLRTKRLVVGGRNGPTRHDNLERLATRGSGVDVGGRLLAALTVAPLDRRRPSFSNPFGWALGEDGTAEGDVLVRVVLREEAVVLTFGDSASPRLSPFRARRVGDGSAVAPDDLAAHGETVAAVFVTGFSRSGILTRDVLLVNEGMIERWELGTDTVAEELSKAEQALRKLAEAAPSEAAHDPMTVRSTWMGQPQRADLAVFESSLGSGSPTYAFARPKLLALADRLAAARRPEPLRVTPSRSTARALPQAAPRSQDRRIMIHD